MNTHNELKTKSKIGLESREDNLTADSDAVLEPESMCEDGLGG